MDELAGQNEVRMIEVGPRDGLQNLDAFIPMEQKISLIQKLAACGFREIQVGAFVSPQAIPQFRDMPAVLAGLGTLERVNLTALVPNIQGARNALDSGIKKLNFFFSVSRSHNLNNVRQTPETSISNIEEILREIRPDTSVKVRVDLATAFGCPFEGRIETTLVLHYVERMARLGIREVTLCDTAGLGNPRLVGTLSRDCLKNFPEVVFGMHFHDTRGLGLAEEGIRTFDGAVGGFGGCPYAPGASGNVATEAVVFMFEEMGIKTGISLPGLLDVAGFLKVSFPGAVLRSALLEAGLPKPFGPL
ncbi:MAG: hydroxymethylglutaryl-CoA lyase [Syntrophales bacterium]